MKSVLISIRPKWCELIATGEKTVEMRKTRPNIQTPFKCYIYCTKRKMVTCSEVNGNGNGKVIGEFICDKLTYVEARIDDNGEKHLANANFLLRKSFLSEKQMFDYLYNADRKTGGGWAWHISDLKIYDEPKELSEFWAYNEELHKRYDSEEDFCCYNATNEYGEALTDCGDSYNNILNCYRCWEEWSGWCHHVTSPPQSWFYVEELQNI